MHTMADREEEKAVRSAPAAPEEKKTVESEVEASIPGEHPKGVIVLVGRVYTRTQYLPVLAFLVIPWYDLVREGRPR